MNFMRGQLLINDIQYDTMLFYYPQNLTAS